MSYRWNHRLCSQASFALPHILWYLCMLCLVRSLFFFFFDWVVFHCEATMQFPFFRLCLCSLSKAAKDESVHVSLWTCVWNSLLIPTTKISASWTNARLTSWDSCKWFPRATLPLPSLCGSVWTFQLCNLLTHIRYFHSFNFSHSVCCTTFLESFKKHFGLFSRWPLPWLCGFIHVTSSRDQPSNGRSLSFSRPNWYLSSLSILSFCVVDSLPFSPLSLLSLGLLSNPSLVGRERSIHLFEILTPAQRWNCLLAEWRHESFF